MARILDLLAEWLDDEITGNWLSGISITLLVLGLGHEARGPFVQWHYFIYATALALPFAVIALASAITMIDEDYALKVAVATAVIGLFTPASSAYPNLHTNYLWLVVSGTAFIFATLMVGQNAGKWTYQDGSMARFNRAIAFAVLAAPIGVLLVNHTWTAILWSVLAAFVLLAFYELLKYYGKTQVEAGATAHSHA